jgi:ketosteroid isomerase-like protein
MPETTSKALQTALRYFHSWTAQDFDRAMAFLAPDLVCHAPSGRIDGAEAFRGFMEPLSQILVRAELVSAFGDDRTALLMYDTQTVPVAHAPGAECLTVEDGLITEIKIIFDRVPFAAARQAADGS